MRKRRLGGTDLELSVVGLGTWALAGPGWKYAWGPQDDAESVRTVRRAVELGINWLDTAPVYGNGHAENVAGRALSEMREKPLVATKCGRFAGPDGDLFSRIKPDSIRSEVEASLRRLRLERIDLYQIHWPDLEHDIERAWETLGELVRQGKIRHAGVSNFNVPQMRRLMPIRPVDSLQLPYSLLRREIESEILPFCAENGIGVIAYSPLQKGLLTGRITPERASAFPEGDHRASDPMFRGERLNRILGFVRGLESVASSAGLTPAQLALAWGLRRPGVTSVLVGGRRPGQLEETAAAGERDPGPDVLDAVEALIAEHGI
jgi:aryl-alcohol dehydrogenase-like predicted oxidoreductase